MIDYKLFDGFALRQTDEQTDICDCRVAFATEKFEKYEMLIAGQVQVTCGLMS